MRKLPFLFVVASVLAAISLGSFIYGAYRALISKYQESVFLFGIGFIVLALSVFVYRVHRYPDKRGDAQD